MKYLNFILIGLALMSIACEGNSDYTLIPKDTSSIFGVDVKLEHGRLVFEDMESFANAYQNLSEQGLEDGMMEMNKELNFPSMYRKFDEIEERIDSYLDLDEALRTYPELVFLEDSSLELKIEDWELAFFLNESGEIQIGDSLIRVSQDTVLIAVGIDPGGFSEISFSTNLKGTSIFKVEREVASYQNSRSSCGKKCSRSYARNRRLRGKILKINFRFFKIARVSSRAQKKRWWGWKRTRVSWIEVQGGFSDFPTSNRIKNRRNKKSVSILLGISGGSTAPSLPLGRIWGKHNLANGEGTAYCRTCR